jgi:hypothetical protein
LGFSASIGVIFSSETGRSAFFFPIVKVGPSRIRPMPRIFSGVRYSPSSQIASTSVTNRLNCWIGATRFVPMARWRGSCSSGPHEMHDAGG